jgi:5-methylcytosine-specific restriction protein A
VPIRPPRACTGSPGCPNVVHNGSLCPDCKRKAGVADRAARGSAHARGYNSAWSAASHAFLRAHPFCAICEIETPLSIQPATVTDHIEPHKGDQGLFWDESNWQGLCKPHHDRKTATEDGGFGRAVLTRSNA